MQLFYHDSAEFTDTQNVFISHLYKMSAVYQTLNKNNALKFAF